jgi:hypothetical protein
VTDPHPLDTYRANFPPIMDVLARECVGYHGYGNGRMLNAQSDRPLGAPGPDNSREILGGCNECERKQECWEATIEKARELMPALMELHDEISARGITGKEWLDAWADETGQPREGGKGYVLPPPMILSAENTSHGSFHTAGRRYGDRGSV